MAHSKEVDENCQLQGALKIFLILSNSSFHIFTLHLIYIHIVCHMQHDLNAPYLSSLCMFDNYRRALQDPIGFFNFCICNLINPFSPNDSIWSHWILDEIKLKNQD